MFSTSFFSNLILAAVPIATGLYLAHSYIPRATGSSLPHQRSEGLKDDFFLEPQGKTLTTKHGHTQYIHCGPVDKPLIVFIHGFTGSHLFFQEFSTALWKSEEFQTVTYDLYGHGFSSSPDVEFTEDVMTEQLLEVIQDVLSLPGQSQKTVALVGTSMGGAISAHFASLHPSLVSHLILVCPAGLPVVKPMSAKFVHVPILADYLFAFLGRKIILGSAGKEFGEDQHEIHRRVVQLKTYQMDHNPSHLPSLLSYLRHFPLDDVTASYTTVGNNGTKVLLILGAKDSTIPVTHVDEFKRMMPQTKVALYENSGHYVFLQEEESVQKDIKDFILS